MNPRRSKRDKREIRWTAATYDEVFAHIIEGKHKQIIYCNSKLQYTDQEHQDEAVQELCLYLHSRYHQRPEELLSLYNSEYFNYWLVKYTKQTSGSNSSKYDRVNRKRYESLDIRFDNDEDEDEVYHPVHIDPEFELEQQPRNVLISDIDVLRWMLDSSDFRSKFTGEKLLIYHTYLDLLIANQEKPRYRDVSDFLQLPIDVVDKAIREVRSEIRRRNGFNN